LSVFIKLSGLLPERGSVFKNHIFFVIYQMQNVLNIRVRRPTDFSKVRKGYNLYCSTSGVECFVSLMPLPFSHKFREVSPSIPPHSGYSSYKCSLVWQTFLSPGCLGQESAFGTLHFLCFLAFDLCTRRSISEK